MFVNGCAGRIFDHVKTVQLEAKWRQSDKAQEGGFSAFLKPNSEAAKANILQRITGKLKMGKRLTYDELDFLRTHAPDLYEKALKIEKEREEFRRELRKCKTKEDARKLQTVKAMQLQAEAKALPKDKNGVEMGDLDFISMRMAAISDEFSEFVKSKEFEELPTQKELDEENKEEGNKYENNNSYDNKNEDNEDGENKNKRKFKKIKPPQDYEMQKTFTIDRYSTYKKDSTMAASPSGRFGEAAKGNFVISL
jgi:hypothetical protein